MEATRLVGGTEVARQYQRLLWSRPAALDAARSEPAQQALFKSWAAEVGLDGGAFATAYDGGAAARRVQQDVELGRELGVTELPTVFLDGKLLRNPQRLAVWEALLGVEPTATSPAPAQPGD
jgi:protein-disulfide isomerase